MSKLKRKFIEDEAVDYTKVDGSIALTSQLEYERSRAIGAEQSIYIATHELLVNETNRASDAENSIDFLLRLEASRAMAAENSINQAIQSEQSRASGAEGILSGRIEFVLENTDPAAIDSLRELINAIQSAETSLNQAILDYPVQEQSRAQIIWASLAQAISDGSSRASEAESLINQAVVDETFRGIAADTNINIYLQSQITRAINVEDSLSSYVPVPATEVFTGSQMIINQYIELSGAPIEGSVKLVIDGITMQKGDESSSTADYFISSVGGNTRLTFLNDLATGGVAALTASDSLTVRYLRSGLAFISPIKTIACRYHLSSPVSFPSFSGSGDWSNYINEPDYDTTDGAYDTNTGTFLCQRNGLYSVKAAMRSTGGNSGAQYQELRIKIDGNVYSVSRSEFQSPSQPPCTVIYDTPYCYAGQRINVVAYSDQGLSFSDSSQNYVTIEKMR